MLPVLAEMTYGRTVAVRCAGGTVMSKLRPVVSPSLVEHDVKNLCWTAAVFFQSHGLPLPDISGLFDRETLDEAMDV